MNQRSRRGAAAIIALALIAVLGAITAVMLKDFHHNRLQRYHVEARTQADQLLADFKERTIARLQADPQAVEERIVIPPFSNQFRGTFTLTFDSEEIQVEYVDEQGKRIYFESEDIK